MGDIRIAGIVRESIVDGPGLRFVVFAQGCPHKCKGCHNPETHSFGGGKICEIEELLKAIGENPLLSGVTFSGGEPFSQPAAFFELAAGIRTRYPNLNILSYTGYTYEELETMAEKNQTVWALMSLCDYMIDGRYIEEERDLTLDFMGSRNQRFIELRGKRNDNTD